MTTLTTVRLLVAQCLLLALSACGQSGPLYIPGNPSTIQPPPAPAETEATEDEDDEAEQQVAP